jgi:hypothetical protein
MAASLLFSRIFVLCLLVFICLNANAQVFSRYNPSLTASSGAYISIAGLGGGQAVTRTIGTTNEGAYNGIDIGFDFWYMGTRYSTVSASTNGWLALGSNILAGNYAPANSLASGGTRPVLAPLWDDLRIFTGILSGGVYVQRTGEIGSRIFTIEWDGMEWTAASNGIIIGFQVKLYEATGRIEFIYNNPLLTPAPTNPSASVGITTSGGGYISITDLTNATATFSSSSENASLNAKPATGRTYNFNPVAATALSGPTNLSFSAVGTTGMTLNWIDNSSDELGFAIYRATSASGPFTHLATTAANTTTYVATGLAANTTYFYRVHAVRESLSAAAAASRATLSNCATFNILQVPTTNIVANYRLNGNATDFYNINNGALQGSPTATTDRYGVSNGALNFNGTSQYISTTNSYANPINFTISVWFRTTTTTGGSLIGFTSNQTGLTGSHDRHIYMGNDGRIHFGVFGGVVRTVNSTTAYNDGNWHQATATMSSSAGITLYLDGALVLNNSAGTSAENFTGYWRMAAQTFNAAWPGAPTSSYFQGALDDAFIFNRVLSASEIATLYNSPYGVQNNGPVCVGTTLQLTAPTVAGAQYSWTGPNGFTSTLQNPTLTYALAAAGAYSVTVNVGGCSDVARTNVASSTVAGNWIGGTNTDWANAANWCNGVVPTASVNVTVPSGRSNYPTVSTDQAANNLTVQSAASVTITNSLSVAGAISNSGKITVSNGRMVFNGTTAQTIPANVFAGNLIKDLTINNAAGVTLNGALRLTGVLTATNGIFNANGNLTLASSASQTAQVAQIPIGASVRGQVKVERFIRGGTLNPYRTSRMLSSPVYDNTANFISINVEGNRSAKFSQLIDDIIISGPQGAAAGFDATASAEPSAWTYSSGFVPIPNINTAVNAGKGMYVYFRGNRSNFGQKVSAPYVDPEDTIVDFDGVLNQGDITVTLPSGNHFLGNPYAATIDWDSPNWGSDKVNVNNALWIWNPVERSYSTYISGLGTLGGSNLIASGQSFFMQTSAAGSIRFKESVKVVGQQPSVMLFAGSKGEQAAVGKNVASNTQFRSVLRMTMQPLSSFGRSETIVAFQDGSSPNYTSEDALHLDGEIVNISSMAGTRRLAINFTPPPTQSWQLPVHINASLSGAYIIKFNLEEYFQDHSLMLRDNYLQSTTQVSAQSNYSFVIDKTNSQTFGANRFTLLVEPPSVLPIEGLVFQARKESDGVLLTWKTSTEINNAGFKLFRAAENGRYQYLATISANGAGSYSYTDRSPSLGRNYYKLVQVDFDGTETEAMPVVVNFVIGENSPVIIYPNPVVDHFTIKVDGLHEELYELNLYNTIGGLIKTVKVTKLVLSDGLKVDVLGVNSGLVIVKLVEFGTGKIVAERKILKM